MLLTHLLWPLALSIYMKIQPRSKTDVLNSRIHRKYRSIFLLINLPLPTTVKIVQTGNSFVVFNGLLTIYGREEHIVESSRSRFSNNSLKNTSSYVRVIFPWI